MADVIADFFKRFTSEIFGGTGIKNSQKKNSSSSVISHMKKPQIRAVLLNSSQIEFGNTCEQLVNVAFEMSQTSSKTMKTCTEITQYIQRELRKQYPKEKFYVIIGENNHFGFAVTDAQYLAEIEQERYRVLIFTTRRGAQLQFDTHDANSQMPLVFSSQFTIVFSRSHWDLFVHWRYQEQWQCHFLVDLVYHHQIFQLEDPNLSLENSFHLTFLCLCLLIYCW
uniref:Uncharacterized protein n=1 Tax=Philodina roseola TaxID=96448 RepID=B6S373_PHIRO|nr:hypothetical protein [Philodina roseola]